MEWFLDFLRVTNISTGIGWHKYLKLSRVLFGMVGQGEVDMYYILNWLVILWHGVLCSKLLYEVELVL